MKFELAGIKSGNKTFGHRYRKKNVGTGLVPVRVRTITKVVPTNINMKIEKIEHIGIAVKNIKDAMKFYGDILGLSLSGIIEVPNRKLRIAFIELAGTKLELLESAGEGSVIDKFIQKKGEGIHHICFEVENFDKTVSELKDKNVEFVDEPRVGAEGKKIVFLQPKNAFGVLIELKEK